MKKNNNNLIVIAEDSPTQAEQLKHILTKNGYRVLHGRDGRDAFNMIKRERPLLIISDVIMPEINGYELCKAVKTDDQLKGIPVILLTVLSDSADVIKGLECGADNFITKPYSAKHLLSRIHNILINKELRKERLSETGIEIFFANKKYYVNSDRVQILDLLLSTYENSIQKNRELIQVNEKLKSTREELETLNN
jgi:DNA-binding response OmpR family regulator